MEPWEGLPEEKENECSFCGAPCNGEFCSRECAKANQND
jgi:hypothetical protein